MDVGACTSAPAGPVPKAEKVEGVSAGAVEPPDFLPLLYRLVKEENGKFITMRQVRCPARPL